MKIIILDAYTTDQGRLPWEELSALGEVVRFDRTPSDPEEIVRRCLGAQVVLTNKAPITEAVIKQLPTLQYIGVLATGIDAIDLEAARKRCVAVTNVPGYSTESVAQLVFAMMLRFLQNVDAHSRRVKSGEWAVCEDFCFFDPTLTELEGKTMTVLGFGAIGRAVGRLAEAFGMSVIAAQVPGSASPGRVPIYEALAIADVVTLHCPLTDKTEGLVNSRFLDTMKPDAVLINTGRGKLLNVPDVVDALSRGRLRGLGVDVLWPEPPSADHPLCAPDAPWADRVVITPHMGWGTVEARQRLLHEASENVRSFLAGLPRNRVV